MEPDPLFDKGMLPPIISELLAVKNYAQLASFLQAEEIQVNLVIIKSWLLGMNYQVQEMQVANFTFCCFIVIWSKINCIDSVILEKKQGFCTRESLQRFAKMKAFHYAMNCCHVF